jgi:LmbE family N-acetylglucosaminyl deacetylase
MGRGSQTPAERLEGRVVALSPHLDDAALSLGGSIAEATVGGADVRVVTVFAYDPAQDGAAAPWDAACGFRSSGEAARVRRAEDARACVLMGAGYSWLPFADEEYGRSVSDDLLWEAIAGAIGNADSLLVPGFPLVIGDHARVTRLALTRAPQSLRVGLYVEQPYASLRLMSRGGRVGAPDMSPSQGLANALRLAVRARRPPEPELHPAMRPLVGQRQTWLALGFGRSAWLAKQRAVRAHRSQVRGFGPLVLPRIALYESAWGGEGLTWVR